MVDMYAQHSIGSNCSIICMSEPGLQANGLGVVSIKVVNSQPGLIDQSLFDGVV